MKGMRLSRSEVTAIVITLVLAALVGGYHLGSRDVRADSTYMTVSTLQASAVNDVAAQSESHENVQTSQGVVNINTASEAELQLLPGIGEVRAKNIVDYREKNGPFEKIEDITLVSGIGSGIFEDIIDLITVGGN